MTVNKKYHNGTVSNELLRGREGGGERAMKSSLLPIGVSKILLDQWQTV